MEWEWSSMQFYSSIHAIEPKCRRWPNKIAMPTKVVEEITTNLEKKVRSYSYSDQKITGVIYAGNNINAGLAAVKTGATSFDNGQANFVVNGNLIAHGNNDNGSNINIKGFGYNGIYVDPSCTAIVNMLKNNSMLQRLMWASW